MKSFHTKPTVLGLCKNDSQESCEIYFVILSGLDFIPTSYMVIYQLMQTEAHLNHSLQEQMNHYLKQTSCKHSEAEPVEVLGQGESKAGVTASNQHRFPFNLQKEILCNITFIKPQHYCETECANNSLP